MTVLARILKVYLSINDIDQKTFAAEVGISESSITRLFQGKMVSAQAFTRIIAWMAKEDNL